MTGHTVRDATFDVLRRFGLTTLFANPGSTEIALLTGLPDDQALWSAAHYCCGVLFVMLANGRYAVMDRLAEQRGTGKAPWPAFDEVGIARLAEGLGCPAIRATTHDALLAVLDDVVPTLRERGEPLLLEVAVTPDRTFAP